MELQTRAQFLARVISVLYGRRDLRGRLTSATRGARFLSLGIRLADPLGLDTALKLAEPLALATNTPAVIAQRREDAPGLVSYQFQLQDGYWHEYTRADVTGLGVGLGESKRQIDFGFEPPHALIAGTTDSGKSETVRSILAGLLTSFSPADLGLILVDPHRDFDDLRSAAHLAYPVASGAGDIDAALSYAGQELARRKEANDREAPRLAVVIDEAQDALDGERLAIAQRIAAEARKFRVNLIVASQRATQKNLPELIHQTGNRFIGVCSDARESATLTGQAGLQAHKLTTGGGDFLHVAGAKVERLQVALATDADIARIPRAEIARPEVAEEDTPRLLNYPEERGPGRPRNEPEPRAVAHYLWYGDKLSISRAAELLGLSKRGHYLNRDFAAEVKAELIALRGAKA